MHSGSSGLALAHSLETSLIHAVVILAVGGVVLAIVMRAMASRRQTRKRRLDQERRQLVRSLHNDARGGRNGR